MILQLANYYNIALNKEHCYNIYWVDFSYTNASISARSVVYAMLIIFTGILISHDAQNHQIGIVNDSISLLGQCLANCNIKNSLL